jgi:hypothetical protein
MSNAHAIESADDLPLHGCITVKGWEAGSRRRGYHVEKVNRVACDGGAEVWATPMKIGGGTNGAPREILLRFGLDTIEVSQ